MNRLSRTLLLTLAGLAATAAPAAAQTTGEFSYSPVAQQRGGSVQISGRCVSEGTTENVDMIVTVRQGADGQGDYGFSKGFIPAENGNVSGTIEVPGDAPLGDYVIGGACRNGPTVFFSKNGPFTVVAQGAPVPSATTTTAAPAATTTTTGAGAATTTTTTAEETTTTTEADGTEEADVETTVDDDVQSATTTTIDEFAATREEEDDSIGPLLILVGVLPLVLAVAAVALAMRRRGAPPAA